MPVIAIERVCNAAGANERARTCPEPVFRRSTVRPRPNACPAESGAQPSADTTGERALKVRKRLITNPQADAKLRATAARYVDEGVDTPQALQARLRGEYPNARVIAGIIELAVERWYVYREGRWVAG
jgi:hypothetical protein